MLCDPRRSVGYEVAHLLCERYDTTINGPVNWQAVILHGNVCAVISMLDDERVELELTGFWDGIDTVYFDQRDPDLAAKLTAKIEERCS